MQLLNKNSKQISFKTFLSDPMKNPHICGRPSCSLEGNKFDYAPNIRYKYNYRVHVRSEFSGSGENSSDVFIAAKLLLTFPTKCEGVLSVQDVQLRDFVPPEEEPVDENDYNFDYSEKDDTTLHPKSSQFSADIQEHELRYLLSTSIPMIDPHINRYFLDLHSTMELLVNYVPLKLKKTG